MAGVLTAPALGFGWWRMQGVDNVAGGHLVDGHLWAWFTMLLLAGYAGTVARQTRELARLNQDLNEAQQRLSALHTIALSLSTTLDATRLVEKILEQVGKLWGYDYGAILLLDEATGELVVAEARGYRGKPGDRIPPGQGICHQVLRTGQPICIGDVTEHPDYLPGVESARSEVAVPLVWEGRTLGVLNVESRLPHAYGLGDVTLLATVADQAAAALGNARLHEQTQQLAMTDPHTGLYNYRYLQEQVTAMVRDSQLSGAAFSLIMLDIDHFKRCNDTYGHPTGDAVLEQVARLLKETVRSRDLCFRYGGEEFAVTLPGAGPEVSARIAERIRERIETHVFSTKSERTMDFPITASVGVATYPRDGMTQVDLLLAADRAMYAAKSEGRNRVITGLQTKFELPTDLKKA